MVAEGLLHMNASGTLPEQDNLCGELHGGDLVEPSGIEPLSQGKGGKPLPDSQPRDGLGRVVLVRGGFGGA